MGGWNWVVDFGMEVAVIDIFGLDILDMVVDFGMIAGLDMVVDSGVAAAASVQGMKSCVEMDYQRVTQTAPALR